MRIDKLEQMVYALDIIIDRYSYNGREMTQRNFESFRDEIYGFYHDMLQSYCGHLMSQVIIRNELIANFGEEQADRLYNQLFRR